ncbi:hypothetical protein ASD80_00355 [Devosia sp. Root635]|nr:hypothetical protein ASD80_00355 [Devosia sp. Root635]
MRASRVETELGLDAHVDQIAGVAAVFDEMGVVFEKFGGNGQNAFQQFIKACCLCDQARNIIACGNPNARFIVPLGNDEKLFRVGS